jgi:hypothetical protein
MNYEDINRAVNAVFFDGRYAHQPVYLDLEDSSREELAEALDISVENLESEIGRHTAHTLLEADSDAYAYYLRELDKWNTIGRKTPPPFTGLLYVLSIAAEHMRADEKVSSSNYYRRLFEVLGINDESGQQKIKHSARSTRQLWRALNQWLMSNDLAYGRPTARQVNGWKYVSYALSQALIRDADRKKFHDMFSQYGLSPFEVITDGEMQIFLHEWMRGGGPTAWLKKMWAKRDLRERVSAAALSELEAWDGADMTGRSDGFAQKRMSWAAALSPFPRRLKLWLSAFGDVGDTAVSLRLAEDASAIAKEAFQHCVDGIWLSPAAGVDFSIVEPTNGIALPALLASTFELVEKSTAHRYVHKAKGIIPLLKLDSSVYYREVSRVSLLSQHLVLCHESWLSKSLKYLEGYARPGFKACSPEEIEGLPAGWRVIQNVEITFIAKDHPDAENLGALIPLAEGVTMQFSDGLRLSSGAWHFGAPPTAKAASDSKSLVLEIRKESFADDEEVVTRREGSRGVCIIKPDELGLKDGGDFSVVALDVEKEISEKHFSLRSAEYPRPTTLPSLAYWPESATPSAFISAKPLKDQEKECNGQGFVMGMLAPPVVSIPNSRETIPFSLDIDDDANFQGEQFNTDYRLNAIGGEKASCSIRGYHRWKCEDYEKGQMASAPRRMQCMDCQSSVFTRNRTKKKTPLQQKMSTVHTEPMALPSPVVTPPTRAAEKVITPDLLLDAICYLGSGKWHAFQAVACAGSEETWFASEFAKQLHDLGHIDLQLNPALARIQSWSVSPPALVFTGCTAFLAGYRNKSFLEKVISALDPIGTRCAVEGTKSSPTVYRWENLDRTKAADALVGIRDARDDEISVTESPSMYLSTNGVSIQDLLPSLPTVQFEAPPDLQRFETRKGRWVASKDSRQPGAYRTSFSGRRLFFRTPEGPCKEASFEIVKILAAAHEGIHLHGYDPVQRTFISALGCEPPGLLRRALVASSGELPAKEQGRVLFKNVDPEVARFVLDRIYGS